MIQGLKKRTRKAFGLRKKEKDTDSTGSPDKDGVSRRKKKTNGAPNGYYGEIDLDRYAAPDVDADGFSLRPGEERETAPKGKQHFSSSDTEDEDDNRKFKIKIKPLPSDTTKCAIPSMDELKASVGGLALSPSLRRSPVCSLFLFVGLRDAARTSKQLVKAILRLILPPHTEVPPCLTWKMCSAPWNPAGSMRAGPRPDGSASTVRDHPHQKNRPRLRPLPILLLTRPTPSLPPQTPPASPRALLRMSLPPPRRPFPLSPTHPSPSSPFPLQMNPFPLPPDFLPPDSPPCIAINPSLFLDDDEILEYSHAPSTPAAPLEYSPAPTSPIPPPLPAERSLRAGIPSPLVFLREEQPDFMSWPLVLTPGFRGVPSPLLPPAYRPMVSSPGPCPGSGPSSPPRPATPLSGGSPVPPPLPTRPSSRPKLPPGKPMGDLTRPFSPPVSGSPPPFAPLARAESSSSITLLSAASTPTLGRELNISTTGCSRGPSPLTMGAQDTLPVAAAFTETINAYFKGADPSKCVVKITGEMVLSFPAGITRHFASHPSAPVLTFSISNYCRLEQVLPNPHLLCCDTTMSSVDTKEFWVNMPNLMSHLRRVADQKPQATYYNVDMIKYQVAAEGIQSTPLNLAVSWRGDTTSTDLRIDYKYNKEAMAAAPSPLHNIHFLVPVDGGVAKLQAMIPTATWNPEQQNILWKISSLSQRSENGGVGALLGRFQLTEGPSKPSQLAVQFTSEGSTLSGCDIQLVGTGYRLSLVKKRFAAGKYLADN
ncbi:SH3-containing GRB2-like protein 3-interacting protein 1 [Oncorhynchus keta]|uniref:SH3-containing GRB2-like protein 3-interacting protein 1 n=1 Tax=Oncorhynchus keta TaxID=8018 RepID=UPI00227B58EA|nr:SH3-containing GRB2-like protein 3-interacting protein 1 [Oncorhynchus keta]